MEAQFEDPALLQRAEAVAIALRTHGRTLALAESCTGGWIAKICTDLAGSSAWFERGYVTYSNLAKSEAVGVPPTRIQRYGAVSEMVAADMAAGARRASHADWAIAVTGIAGPNGGSPDKPVGTVCFGWIGPEEEAETETCLFSGDRDAVRRQTVAHALDGLLVRL